MVVTIKDCRIEIDGGSAYNITEDRDCTESEAQEIFELCADQISEENHSFKMMGLYDSSKGD